MADPVAAAPAAGKIGVGVCALARTRAPAALGAPTPISPLGGADGAPTPKEPTPSTTPVAVRTRHVMSSSGTPDS